MLADRITRDERQWAHLSLRLYDAMAEANGETEDEGDDGAPVRQSKVATRLNGGIRFQRCGGGVRVIRRQRRAN